jgi:hypothetical protein
LVSKAGKLNSLIAQSKNGYLVQKEGKLNPLIAQSKNGYLVRKENKFNPYLGNLFWLFVLKLLWRVKVGHRNPNYKERQFNFSYPGSFRISRR